MAISACKGGTLFRYFGSIIDGRNVKIGSASKRHQIMRSCELASRYIFEVGRIAFPCRPVGCRSSVPETYGSHNKALCRSDAQTEDCRTAVEESGNVWI